MDFIFRKFRTLGNYISALGLIGGLRWGIIKGADRAGLSRKAVRVHPKGLKYPLSIRTNKSSDSYVFDHIFVTKEYSFLDRLSAPVQVIVDLGANVGCASALFLSTYPKAFVLAVEPDPGNFERCQQNLLPYGKRSKTILGAVWHTGGNLVLSRGTFGDGKEWATEVRAAAPGERADVVAYDIPQLMKMCPSDRIDLLKIDIEGSEKALFAENTQAWLGKVRNLCIELHGPECRAALNAALANYDYQTGECAEYTLCLNITPRASARSGAS